MECRACFLEELERVIAERLRERPEGSYTAAVAERGLGYAARKLGEEAAETMVEALVGGEERLAEEAADLVYHLLVLLNMRGVRLSDVVAVLEERAGWRRG